MDTRRDFVAKMIASGAAILSPFRADSRSPVPAQATANARANSSDTVSSFPRSGALGGIRVDDPYADVDWKQFQQVASASHVHIENQQKLDNVYHKMGLRHMPISNYYPSAPMYPIKSIRYNQYAVQ